MSIDPEILIPHGQTPSGFGLMLHYYLDKWWLRPLSPCCGAFVDAGEGCICVRCKVSWDEFTTTTDATIANNVPVSLTPGVIASWIQGFTKYDDDIDVRVKVEWPF